MEAGPHSAAPWIPALGWWHRVGEIFRALRRWGCQCVLQVSEIEESSTSAAAPTEEGELSADAVGEAKHESKTGGEEQGTSTDSCLKEETNTVDVGEKLGEKNGERNGADYVRSCEGCSFVPEEGRRLLRCSRCHSAYYCNKACQKMHYKIHKRICKPLRRSSARLRTTPGYYVELPGNMLVLIAEHFVGHLFMDWRALLGMQVANVHWRQATADQYSSASIWRCVFQPPSSTALLHAIINAPPCGLIKVDLSGEGASAATPKTIHALHGKPGLRYLNLLECRITPPLLASLESLVADRHVMAASKPLHLIVNSTRRLHHFASDSSIQITLVAIHPWHCLQATADSAAVSTATSSSMGIQCDACDDLAQTSDCWVEHAGITNSPEAQVSPLTCMVCRGWFCGQCDRKSKLHEGKGLMRCCCCGHTACQSCDTMKACLWYQCGRTICTSCRRTRRGCDALACGRVLCDSHGDNEDIIGYCNTCNKNLCENCGHTGYCDKCNTSLCENCGHTDYCDTCNTSLCENCGNTGYCDTCNKSLCENCGHTYYCDTCNKSLCENCGHADYCDTCNTSLCENCANTGNCDRCNK